MREILQFTKSKVLVSAVLLPFLAIGADVYINNLLEDLRKEGEIVNFPKGGI